MIQIIVFNFCSGKSVFLISRLPGTLLFFDFREWYQSCCLIFLKNLRFGEGKLPLISIDRHLRHIMCLSFLTMKKQLKQLHSYSWLCILQITINNLKEPTHCEKTLHVRINCSCASHCELELLVVQQDACICNVRLCTVKSC